MPLAAASDPPNPNAPTDGAALPARYAGLSNLRVLPNLLTEGEYQDEIYSCTLDEILDFGRREPTIFSRERLSREDRYEFVARQGPNLRAIPRLSADGRATRWIEAARGGLAAAVAALEERADLEDGFELLVLIRESHYATEDEQLRAEAAACDRCVCAVLLRPEFRLTPELIEERLESIIGRPLANPNPLEPARVPEPAAEEHPPAIPASPAPPPTHAEPPAEKPAPELLTPTESTGTVAEPPAIVAISAPVTAPEVVAPTPEPPAIGEAAPADDGLATVMARWAGLPDHVKSCILMLIDAADRLRSAKE